MIYALSEVYSLEIILADLYAEEPVNWTACNLNVVFRKEAQKKTPPNDADHELPGDIVYIPPPARDPVLFPVTKTFLSRFTFLPP